MERSRLCLSVEETHEIAAGLAVRTPFTAVFCLYGPMGSGKTTFVQGLSRALGCRTTAVSPTFNLVREYRIKGGRLYHLDLFRLNSLELHQLGLEDYFSDPKGICAIEWAGCAREWLPGDRVDVHFGWAGAHARRLRFRARGVLSEKLLSGI